MFWKKKKKKGKKGKGKAKKSVKKPKKKGPGLKIRLQMQVNILVNKVKNLFIRKEGSNIAKKGFKFYLLNKRYNVYDVLEPLLALPFAYLVIMLGTGEMSQLKLIFGAFIVLGYIPLMFYILKLRRK